MKTNVYVPTRIIFIDNIIGLYRPEPGKLIREGFRSLIPEYPRKIKDLKWSIEIRLREAAAAE
jgi:hypothetical protein